MSSDPIDKLNVRGSSVPLGDPDLDAGAGYGQYPEPQPTGMGHNPGGVPTQNSVGRVLVRRDVFWNNVVRDILMAMASAAAMSSGRLKPTVTGAETSTSPVDEMFDGRVGVMTSLGQRIPIADIYPVFSCSSAIPGMDRSLAADVQCSIFRIRTPTGESYTLPLSQIIGVHSLSDELVEQLERASEQSSGADTDHIDNAPFGFAAYTAMAQAERAARQAATEEQSGSEKSDSDAE